MCAMGPEEVRRATMAATARDITLRRRSRSPGAVAPQIPQLHNAFSRSMLRRRPASKWLCNYTRTLHNNHESMRKAQFQRTYEIACVRDACARAHGRGHATAAYIATTYANANMANGAIARKQVLCGHRSDRPRPATPNPHTRTTCA